jgi:hypothetical protein
MKKYIYLAVMTLVVGASVLSTTLVASPALAVDPKSEIKTGIDDGAGGNSGISLKAAIKVVVNVLMFIVGAVSVIMIIIGGLKYVVSNGDSNQIQSAKNTILYAVIGIVVALLAFAIVSFVVDAFVTP